MSTLRAKRSYVSIHFLPARSSHRKKSQRDVELEDSEARSHAARISHQKSRRNDGDRRVCEARYVTERAYDQGLSYLGSYSLDPFVRLVVDISLEERKLFHECELLLSLILIPCNSSLKWTDLTLTPQAVFGTSRTSLFCAVRDITLVSVATSEIPLRWAILLAQNRRLSNKGIAPENNVSMLYLRQKAYKSLSKLVAHLDDGSPSDEILYGTLVAGIAEHRIGNKKTAMKHLEASFILWNKQQRPGSMEKISFPDGLTFCVGYLGIGLENFFKTSAALKVAQIEILNVLGEMEAWNSQVRSRDRVEQGACQIPSETSSTLKFAVFGKRGIVRHQLLKLMEEKSEYGIRLCLGALFALNNIFYVLRENDAAIVNFILRLTAHMSSPDGTRERKGLSSTAIIYIVGSCAREAKHTSSLYESCFTPRLWMQFIDLMMLASLESRREVVDVLARWIFVDMKCPDDWNLRSQIWGKRIIRETDVTWRRQQSTMAEE